MADPVFFTVEADYKSVVADSALDVDADPQLGPVTATVIFTPILKAGDVILATDAAPRPTGFVAAPIIGRIDTDGRLKLRVDPDLPIDPYANLGAFPGTGVTTKVYRATDTGLHYRWNGTTYVESEGFTPVRLLADTPVLELEGALYYDVKFTNVQYNGQKGNLNGFGFRAPNADETVNLIEVGRVPGIPASGVTRGPAGPVGVDGVQPSTDGLSAEFLRDGDVIGAVPLPGATWDSVTGKPDLAPGSSELSHSFLDDANGTPTTADSGQTWTRTGAAPVVASGRYVINDTSNAVIASYLTAPLQGSASFIEADFDFGASGATDGHTACLVAWASNLPSGAFVSAPDTPAHVTFTRTGYGFWVKGSGGDLTQLGFHSYGYNIGTETQHVEIAIDKANSVAYVKGADGIVTQWSDARIGAVTAPYVSAEIFYNNASTDKRVRYQRFGATSTPILKQTEFANRAAFVRDQFTNQNYSYILYGLNQTALADKVGKGELVLNFADYGACDGVTNDTAALTTALGILGAAGGGTLRLPPAQIALTLNAVPTFSIPAKVRIEGTPGATELLLTTNTVTDRVLFRSNGNDIVVSGVKMVRNADFPLLFIDVGAFTNLRFEHCYFDGKVNTYATSYVHGIGLNQVGTKTNIAVYDCDFTRMRSAVVQDNATTSTVDTVIVDRCRFAENIRNDLEFNAPNATMRNVSVLNSSFRDNASATFGFGVAFAHVTGGVVDNCDFKNYYHQAIHVEDYSTKIDITASNRLVRCGYGSGAGINVLSGSSEVSIEAKIDATANTNSLYAISITAGGGGNTPGGRPVIAPYRVTVGDKTQILCGATYQGIYVENCPDVTIGKATIIGAGTVTAGVWNNGNPGAGMFVDGPRLVLDANTVRGFRYGIRGPLNTAGRNALGNPGLVRGNMVSDCYIGILGVTVGAVNLSANVMANCVRPMIVGEGGSTAQPASVVGNFATGCVRPFEVGGKLIVVRPGSYSSSVGAGRSVDVADCFGKLPIGTVINFSGGGVLTLTAATTQASTGAVVLTGNVTAANIGASDVGTVTGIAHSTTSVNDRCMVSDNADLDYSQDGGPVGSELLWATRDQGRKIPVRRTEFRTKANTTTPAVTEDTRQTVAYSHTPSDAALKIAGGRLTFTPATTGAGYRSFDAGAALTRLGARFVFNGSGKTTVGGSVTFAMMNQSVASMNTALRIGVHVSITPIGWEVTKLSNATGSIVSTTLAAGQFPAMLAVDNITEYEADIYHQAGSTSATVKLPLGLAVTVTDSDLATWAGNYGFIECFTGLATDILPAFTETWSDTGVQVIPSSDPAVDSLNARGEVAYSQIVTSPTLATAAGSGADVAGLSVTVPFRGRPVMLEANLGFLKNASGAGVTLQIINSSGAVLQQAEVIMVAGPLDYVQAPLLKYRIPAGTAQDTYTVRAYGPSGSQLNMQGTPAYIHAVAL